MQLSADIFNFVIVNLRSSAALSRPLTRHPSAVGRNYAKSSDERVPMHINGRHVLQASRHRHTKGGAKNRRGGSPRPVWTSSLWVHLKRTDAPELRAAAYVSLPEVGRGRRFAASTSSGSTQPAAALPQSWRLGQHSERRHAVETQRGWAGGRGRRRGTSPSSARQKDRHRRARTQSR